MSLSQDRSDDSRPKYSETPHMVQLAMALVHEELFCLAEKSEYARKCFDNDQVIVDTTRGLLRQFFPYAATAAKLVPDGVILSSWALISKRVSLRAHIEKAVRKLTL